MVRAQITSKLFPGSQRDDRAAAILARSGRTRSGRTRVGRRGHDARIFHRERDGTWPAGRLGGPGAVRGLRCRARIRQPLPGCPHVRGRGARPAGGAIRTPPYVANPISPRTVRRYTTVHRGTRRPAGDGASYAGSAATVTQHQSSRRRGSREADTDDARVSHGNRNGTWPVGCMGGPGAVRGLRRAAHSCRSR
jgi:hypothetical protein